MGTLLLSDSAGAHDPEGGGGQTPIVFPLQANTAGETSLRATLERQGRAEKRKVHATTYRFDRSHRRQTDEEEERTDMSWQTYVDDHLMVDLPGGGKLAYAAIYGQDGGCWAQSAGFPALDADQAKILVTGFSDPGAVAASGLRIGDRKYISIGGRPGRRLQRYRREPRRLPHRTEHLRILGWKEDGRAQATSRRVLFSVVRIPS